MFHKEYPKKKFVNKNRGFTLYSIDKNAIFLRNILGENLV